MSCALCVGHCRSRVNCVVVFISLLLLYTCSFTGINVDFVVDLYAFGTEQRFIDRTLYFAHLAPPLQVFYVVALLASCLILTRNSRISTVREQQVYENSYNILSI